MNNSHFAPDAITFLAGLGWIAKDFETRCVDGQMLRTNDVFHPTITGLKVCRASLRTKSRNDQTVFVFEWTGPDYPHKDLAIEPKTIDIKKPHWRKVAMLWYTRTVFTVEQIRLEQENQNAERETKLLTYATALRDAMPADCKVEIDDLQRVGSFGVAYDTRDIIHASTRVHRFGWSLPESFTLRQKVEKLARLTQFLIDQGFVRA